MAATNDSLSVNILIVLLCVCVCVAAVTDPGVSPSEDPETDAGPVFSTSSDGEPAVPAPKRRPRRRAARPEAGRRVVSHDDAPAGAVVAVRKTPRAKSQPPISTKENRRPASRTGAEARRTQNPVRSSGRLYVIILLPMYEYIYEYMEMYIYISPYIYGYMYIYIFMYIYIYTYVYIYVII